MRGKYESKILTPDECFSYVVTHLNTTKGDKMEFVDVVKELGKKLDFISLLQKNYHWSLCSIYHVREEI